uniref:Uncharacterized protein n=1 Tax=Haptolina brevifila TaxID=156173 RepID=A0A7S2HLP3_9EUKA|mmetsp:Transcript_55923/g.110992  ORF Transcript_55923/g.110992 Transcript_55923/m.110992 type:complete len:164 (+) Transcript_55923:103-594(+)|eukprot:CAMPEP_0174711020 /NCGR_PEP_ID=MMETSP1094-20130205/12464_1 /TAXON_ID=156173 /ORGANISM="Chrysochromulina brevifilum, Strain UTEX LB 985" /LENGTH=163 /DNA_ID=CAMNT_0015909901 /DNA_START=92 /DNA_END=583 /DNA_ORIENTATION=-
MPKKKGKKGKGKVEYLTTPEALAPFDMKANDIVATPLGVECTVHGVMNGSLYLKWPGGIISAATPAPQVTKSKVELETYGYHKRPQSAHIQRSIDDREDALYAHRRYGAPRPKSAALRLPLGPHGVNGTERFAAYKAEVANPGSFAMSSGTQGKGKKPPAKKK